MRLYAWFVMCGCVSELHPAHIIEHGCGFSVMLRAQQGVHLTAQQQLGCVDKGAAVRIHSTPVCSAGCEPHGHVLCHMFFICLRRLFV